jgi:hypothetical protein
MFDLYLRPSLSPRDWVSRLQKWSLVGARRMPVTQAPMIVTEGGKMQMPREVEEDCPHCSGYGIALVLEDGTLVKAGDVLINKKLWWCRCPSCDVFGRDALSTPDRLLELHSVQSEA